MPQEIYRAIIGNKLLQFRFQPKGCTLGLEVAVPSGSHQKKRTWESQIMELALLQGNALAFIFRWIHLLAGVAWIGLLWYFNFVQGE